MPETLDRTHWGIVMATRSTRTLRALLCGASLSLIALASPALAAPADADQPTAEAGEDEIVSAIAGEKLDALNSSGMDIRFLAARVPSLQAESSFGRTFPRFYIRGLGNTDFDPNAAQPVSVVYDDVALENAMLKSFPVFDLASVEVLRGPQGTLFGRNTPAGVIKLDSAKPGGPLNGYAQASWATYNTVNAEAAIGGDIGSGFSARASGLLQRRDDWVTNTATTGVADKKLEGYRDLAGRLQLGYSSGDFNALYSFHIRDLKGTPRVFRAGIFKPGSDNEFVAAFDPKKVALDGYTSQSMTQKGASLRLDYHFAGAGTLYSVTAYEKASVESTGDIDGANCYAFIPGCTLGTINVGAFPSNTGGITKPREFSQEVRFASDDMNGVRVQGGLYYFHQKLSYHEYNYFQGTGNRNTDNNQDINHQNVNENYGVFASVDYSGIDDLILRAGVRYSHDKRHDIVSGYGPNLFGYALPVQARVSGGNVTWDASATYKITPDISLYARAATGYQGPAIQDRVNFGSRQTTAPKQTTFSGEAGIKGALPGGVNFALDAYWYRTKDLQITAVGGSSNSAALISADKAVGYGVEAEFEARPAPNFELTASGSYNFTEIRDTSISVGVCANCTVLDPIVSGRAVIDGNDLPQAPRWVANATARYAVPVGGGEVFAFTDWAYRSSINYFLYDAKEFRGRSLLEGGLKVGYKSDNNWEVAVFSRNITNQIRAISGIDFNNLTGMINDPRIIGGSAKISF
jgi:iron complex outermembrane receptor protein